MPPSWLVENTGNPPPTRIRSSALNDGPPLMQRWQEASDFDHRDPRSACAIVGPSQPTPNRLTSQEAGAGPNLGRTVSKDGLLAKRSCRTMPY